MGRASGVRERAVSPDYTHTGLDVPPVVPMHDTGRVAVFVGVGYRMLTVAQARALAERLTRISAQVESVSRTMASSMALCVFLLLAGCASAPKVITRTVTVDVPVATRVQIPGDLIAPCRVAEPDPACWRDTRREYCNGQLVAIRDMYRAALATCDARMTQLRALDSKGGTP